MAEAPSSAFDGSATGAEPAAASGRLPDLTYG